MLQKYAQLIVDVGINLQAGQILVINSPLAAAPLARAVAAAAYKRGAYDVIVSWHDEEFTKLRYDCAGDAALSEFPAWRHAFYMGYAERGAAVVSLVGDDPDLLRKTEPHKIMLVQKANGEGLLEYRARLMANKNAWTIAPYATAPWAKKIFPSLSETEAVDRLWQEIYRAVRITPADDPIAAWQQHTDFLRRAADFMNGHAFKSLHYQNSLGTDLTLKLPDGHIWAGGAEYTENHTRFVANMPTEEIYTLPCRNGAEGTVYATKPLNYQGKLIKDFRLVFHSGKVTDFSASTGEDTLRELIAADEGASYLGEVALVPYNSPISQSGILFYNTLFDENASCHLALGKAYPTCLKDGENMDSVELARHEVNDSLIHVDFMIGSPDLSIVGTTADGRTVKVFESGNFAF